MTQRLMLCLLLLCLPKYSISQDDSQPNPNLLIEATAEEGRTLLKQLNELEFRRAEVLTLVNQITDLKAKQADLLGELRTQLALEKAAHEYTKRDLKLVSEREQFYRSAYEDLKKPPPSTGMSKAVKWGIIGAVVVAGAVIGYAVTR